VLGLALDPCTDERRAKCREEFPDPAHLAWACAKCKSKRPEDVSPYVDHLLMLHRLKKAGYPFGQDDFDLETWIDLGLVTEILEQVSNIKQWQKAAIHTSLK
jgi:hypothetical protein